MIGQPDQAAILALEEIILAPDEAAACARPADAFFMRQIGLFAVGVDLPQPAGEERPGQLVGAVACQLLDAFAQERVARPAVVALIGDAASAQNRPAIGALHFGERLLCVHLRRDVAIDRNSADAAPVGVIQGVDGRQNVQPGAALVILNHLAAPLSSRQELLNHSFLRCVHIVGAEDVDQRTPDHLRPLPAVDAFGGLVPFCDDKGWIGDDNRIRDTFEQIVQHLQALNVRHAFCDVLRKTDKVQIGLPRLRFHNHVADPCFQRQCCTIRRNDAHLHEAMLTATEQLLICVQNAETILRGDQVDELATDPRRRRPARDGFKGGIQVEDTTLAAHLKQDERHGRVEFLQ